jgi:hypothetical protein
MAITLVVEDGTGKTDANTYVSRADATSHLEGHLYATGWTGATDANKDAALAMATRIIDAGMNFNGAKTEQAQALQWPRYQCINSDAGDLQGLSVENGTLQLSGYYYDANEIPKCLKDATCEMALFLLRSDRTADHDGVGLRSARIGPLEVAFSKGDTRTILPEVVQMFLSKLGYVVGRGAGMVKLVRT